MRKEAVGPLSRQYLNIRLEELKKIFFLVYVLLN
jgi:hypothetical protein